MIITMLAGDVQARVNRTLKALGELERTMLPLVEAAVQTTARPWWDLFGKTFSKGRDTEILLASVGSLEGLATLRARLELCAICAQKRVRMRRSRFPTRTCFTSRQRNGWSPT